MTKNPYSTRQCLEMTACTKCRQCADVCPAVDASNDAEVSSLYRMKGLQQIIKSRSAGWVKKLLRVQDLTSEEWQQFSETVYRCTLCGRCQEVCPVGINLKDLWLSLREDLVSTGFYPKKINMIRDNLEESKNVFSEEQDERAEWVEDMDEPPDDLFCKDKAEVVYFTGCTAAYFPVAQKIPLALADIMCRAKVDFALMGEDEWCCGFPLMGAGLVDMFDEFAKHNVEAVKCRGAKQVVFACPSCYEMWLQKYPWKEAGLELFHATQYLDKLLDEGRIPLEEQDITVTYHDPCDLGRGAREFDAPRRVISKLPGVKFVELPDNRENCKCCGGGGNLEMIDAQLSTEIASDKVADAMGTGAEAIVTSCQQCVRTMLTYAKRNKKPIKVMDITMLVHESMPDADECED